LVFFRTSAQETFVFRLKISKRCPVAQKGVPAPDMSFITAETLLSWDDGYVVTAISRGRNEMPQRMAIWVN